MPFGLDVRFEASSHRLRWWSEHGGLPAATAALLPVAGECGTGGSRQRYAGCAHVGRVEERPLV